MSIFKKSPKKLYDNNVRDARENLQLGVEQVAEYANVAPETITMIEEGKYVPSVLLAQRIAEFLSRPVAELFPVPPAEPMASVGDEERIAFQSNKRASHWLTGVAFAGLLGAFVLQFFDSLSQVASTLFGVWVAAGLGIMISLAVPGQPQLRKRIARRQKRKKAILSTLLGATVYAALMTWMPWDRDAAAPTIRQVILRFFGYGIPWGLMMYYFNYGMWRKGKGGWLEGKDVPESLKKQN